MSGINLNPYAFLNRFRGSGHKLEGLAWMWGIFMAGHGIIYGMGLLNGYELYSPLQWIAISISSALFFLVLCQWFVGSKYFGWDKDTNAEDGYRFIEWLIPNKHLLVCCKEWKLGCMDYLWIVKAFIFIPLAFALLDPIFGTFGMYFAIAAGTEHRLAYAIPTSESHAEYEKRIGNLIGYAVYISWVVAGFKTIWG